ncbi:MAG: ECF-type sigma factor [Acidobacteriota bacterium]
MLSSPEHPRGEVTRLLDAWRAGSADAADQLWPIVYDELRRLAGGVLRDRRPGQDGATSLVHKAYIRLLGSDVSWNDRQHFFAVAARAMRFVLVDEARRQASKKRGAGEVIRLDLWDQEGPAETRRPDEVLTVHRALEKLGAINPRHEQLVELRYFAGLSVEETAEVLAVTPRTLARDWKAVRVWMRRELGAVG